MKPTSLVKISRASDGAPCNVYLRGVYVGQCQWQQGQGTKRVMVFYPHDTLEEWRYSGVDDFRIRLPAEWMHHRKLTAA